MQGTDESPERATKTLTASQVIYGIFKHQIETRLIEAAVRTSNTAAQDSAPQDYNPEAAANILDASPEVNEDGQHQSQQHLPSMEPE